MYYWGLKYDEIGGFYDAKYSEYNGMLTIHEVRYNSYSDIELLNFILQNEAKIKFEDVKNLNKIWYNKTIFDNFGRIIFEETKDLR